MDMDSDRTIGRTNVRSPKSDAVPSSSAREPLAPSAAPSSAAAPPPPPPPPATSSATSTPAASGGGFQWPTSAEHYRLGDRIGQGAFASVWRATVKRRKSGGAGDDDDGREVECAIKVMDLEHVNINISGECTPPRRVVFFGAAVE